jgi:hypothetical protein
MCLRVTVLPEERFVLNCFSLTRSEFTECHVIGSEPIELCYLKSLCNNYLKGMIVAANIYKNVIRGLRKGVYNMIEVISNEPNK